MVKEDGGQGGCASGNMASAAHMEEGTPSAHSSRSCATSGTCVLPCRNPMGLPVEQPSDSSQAVLYLQVSTHDLRLDHETEGSVPLKLHDVLECGLSGNGLVQLLRRVPLFQMRGELGRRLRWDHVVLL